MGKIDDALRKLQKQGAGLARKGNGNAKATNRRLPETVVPIARKKKVEIDGVTDRGRPVVAEVDRLWAAWGNLQTLASLATRRRSLAYHAAAVAWRSFGWVIMPF